MKAWKVSDNLAHIVGALHMRRQALGLTQAELAEKADLTQPAVARFFKMDSTPRIDTAIKIAHALGMRLVLEEEKGEEK